MSDQNYILLLDKNAKKYPSLWWTGPSDNLQEVQNYSDDTGYVLKYLFLYVIIWTIVYFLNPKNIRPSFSIALPPFILGFICLMFWCYYYISNKMIFYDKKHEEYYTFNIPHPRRIILNKNNLNLGDNIGIISIKNYKKLAKKEKLKTENYPDYTRKKSEALIASGKYNPALSERRRASRYAGYNIAFTLFSFAYLISQSTGKNILKKCFYWISLAVIMVFIPQCITWIGLGVSDRDQYEILLDLEQCLTYVGTSFGFLAAYIVYRHTMKKI